MPSTFLQSYLENLSSLFSSIRGNEFEDFIEELECALDRGSKIFICGNGGSATAAAHFTCDLNKGVSFGKERRFRVICLNDNIPLLLAYSNDLSFAEIFVEQLKNFLQKDDLVVGVSSSGNSPNVIKAVEYARQHGARTFAICGHDGGRLKQEAQKSLIINSSDIQKVEDCHLIIFHCAMQYLSRTNHCLHLKKE